MIVSEFVSLDGVMEAPGGEPGYKHSGWVLAVSQDPAQLKYKLDEVLEAKALLLGRVTYEGFDELEWNNSTLVKGDVADAVSKLKRQDGGDILVAGSRTLVHTLIEHDLVDEYRLMVFPIILGSGRRLFPDDAGEKTLLKLVDSEVFDSGVAVHTYHRARDQ